MNERGGDTTEPMGRALHSSSLRKALNESGLSGNLEVILQTRILIGFLTAALFCAGCTGKAESVAVSDKYLRDYDAQMARASEQQRRTDAQISEVDRQMKRQSALFDLAEANARRQAALLDVQEQEARRFDAVLKRWESERRP